MPKKQPVEATKTVKGRSVRTGRGSAAAHQGAAETHQNHRIHDRRSATHESAEQALRESEELYRTAVEFSSDGVKIIQNDRYVYVNRKMVEMCGYGSPDEVIGSPIGLLIHPDDREMVLDINRRRANGEPVPDRYEARHLRKDGGYFHAELSVAPILYRREPALLVYARDVTERKKLEQALRESEEKYRNIFMNSIEGIYQVTPEGRFMSANPAAAAILGYESPQELINSVTDVSTQVYAFPEDRAEALQLLSDQGYLKNFEVRCRHKNGSTVWTSFTARLVRDEQGKLLYHEGTSRDITEKKRLEEELRNYSNSLEKLVMERTEELMRKEEMYRSFVETVSEWIWETDDNGVFTYVSPRAFDILGYRPEEIVGKSPMDFMPPKEARRVARIQKKLLRQRKPIKSLESVCIHKDGRLVYRETNGVPFFGRDGALLGYRGSDRDVSERKMTFEQLKEREADLKQKTKTLEEVNIGYKVLLHQREKDREDLERTIASNVRKLVMPYLEKLRAGSLPENQRLLADVLAANLQEIVSPFLQRLDQRDIRFTTRELEVANLIKTGKTTKEIAELLHVGKAAIDAYRNHIRKKLGLNKKKVNLRSYLSLLS